MDNFLETHCPRAPWVVSNVPLLETCKKQVITDPHKLLCGYYLSKQKNGVFVYITSHKTVFSTPLLVALLLAADYIWCNDYNVLVENLYYVENKVLVKTILKKINLPSNFISIPKDFTEEQLKYITFQKKIPISDI